LWFCGGRTDASLCTKDTLKQLAELKDRLIKPFSLFMFLGKLSVESSHDSSFITSVKQMLAIEWKGP